MRSAVIETDMAESLVTAMVLAAGRGERMRPLTDTMPKPLLTVHRKPLMQWHLEALARGGFNRVVVNTAWLGEQILETFGSVFTSQPPQNIPTPLSIEERSRPSIHIQYSHEGRDFGGALETAGGIARALPLLCPAPVGADSNVATTACTGQNSDVFWVMAGDVFAPDFAFQQADVERFVASGKLAHLWLVPNPEHNLRGDFGLAPDPTNGGGVGLALSLPSDDPQARYTYSTIGLYRAALFSPPWCDIPSGNPQGAKAPLAPLLRAAMAHRYVSAERYAGRWTDVGTPQRLEQLNTPIRDHRAVP